MSLKTDIFCSMALALIPPGNIQKIIADTRHSFWIKSRHPSFKAYFNYPVLAWLDFEPTENELKDFSNKINLNFKLSGLEYINDTLFMAFTDKPIININFFNKKPKNTAYKEGPFSSGHGVFCGKANNFETTNNETIQSKTAMLVAVHLEWADNDSFASTWKVCSQTRLVFPALD